MSSPFWMQLRPTRHRLIKLFGPLGVARFAMPLRVTPVDRNFGFKTGNPIDRYYIEGFLDRHAQDIHGRVLEIHDDRYTRRFGGQRVVRSDILDVEESNPDATIVADLAIGERVPANAFDCAIVCQTLQYIYDFQAALGTLHRLLRPGGVALVTVPGITQVEYYYWAFTERSLRRALDEVFSGEQVRVESHGNVLSACAFLHGLATEELARRELDFCDPDFPVTVAARAVKGTAQP